MVKTIGDFEKEKGMILPNHDPKTEITEDDFNDIPLYEKTMVNHNDRRKFLRANDYKVTRKNMIDSTLSHKQNEEL